MHRFLSTALILTGAVVSTAALVGRVEAGFHHRYACGGNGCLVPGYNGAPGFWACCGGGAGYGYGSGCGAGYGAGYGCGAGYGGYGAYGGTHHCCLGRALAGLHRHHAMKLARRASLYGGACGYGGGYGCGYGDGCGSCGGGYGGCGSGGCADGGCAGGDCVGGSSSGVPINGTTPSGNGEVIYDGPVPPPVPAPADNSSAFMVTRRPFQLASNQTQERDGSAAFERGVSLFRSKSYTDAISAFDGALAAEPKNALYQYYRAMSLFEVHGADAASGDLQQAVQLEREQPVSNWGKRMERVQGRGRVWVESARRAAL